MLLILAAAPVFASDYVLETSVITDWETISHYGSQEEAQKAIDSTITYADIILTQQLGVDLQVTYSDIPLVSSDDVIANHTHPSALIDSIYMYLVNNKNHLNADVTIFLTTRRLSSGSNEYAGYSNIASICRSYSIVIVRLYDNGLDGQTLAHELVHVLGASHDGTAPCESTSAWGYLMSSSTHSGNDQLSQCSMDTVNARIIATGECLLEDNTSEPEVVVTPQPTTSNRGGGSAGLVLLLFLFLIIILRTKKDDTPTY
jgi:hypothetical protein